MNIPTYSALLAAQKIDDKIIKDLTPLAILDIARIIDEVTGLREIVSSLRELYNYEALCSSPDTAWEKPMMQRARLALAKLEGLEQTKPNEPCQCDDCKFYREEQELKEPNERPKLQ